jgi:hypothetical protein
MKCKAVLVEAIVFGLCVAFLHWCLSEPVLRFTSANAGLANGITADFPCFSHRVGDDTTRDWEHDRMLDKTHRSSRTARFTSPTAIISCD